METIRDWVFAVLFAIFLPFIALWFFFTCQDYN